MKGVTVFSIYLEMIVVMIYWLRGRLGVVLRSIVVARLTSKRLSARAVSIRWDHCRGLNKLQYYGPILLI